MTLLTIDWSSFFIKTGQFILSFSILVVLHELGHFLPARWFKCKVEKFYLFFNPWFSLFKKKIGETEYGIGWIPFGGYVKISGMIDESMDKEQLKLPPQDHEFRAKKPWQRLIIMLGGIIVNVLLAIVIFIGIMWHYGEEYIPTKNLQYGIAADSLAQTIGLQNGDKIISIDNKNIEDLSEVTNNIIFKEAKTIEIERAGKPQQISIPATFSNNIIKAKDINCIAPRVPQIIDSVGKSVSIKSGTLLKGDRIIGFNNATTMYLDEFKKAKENAKDVDATITIVRNEKDTINTVVHLSKEGMIGILNKSPNQILGSSLKHYSFLQSIPAGSKACFNFFSNQLTGYKRLIQGKDKASESLGSVISIGKTFPSTWDWHRFWMLTAMFSIMLAFINLLPIPALDGGHALFNIFEMITGKKPSDKFMEYAQTVGMVLLLSLMVYALGLDFWRLFR